MRHAGYLAGDSCGRNILWRPFDWASEIALNRRAVRAVRAAALAECVAGLDRLASELLAQRIDGAFGKRALARLLVDKVGRVGPVIAAEVGDPDAEQAIVGAVSSRSSRWSPVWKMRSANRVGSPSWRLRVRILKSWVLSLSTTVRPAMPAFFSRAETFSESARSTGTRSALEARSTSKVVSADTLFVVLVRLHLALVLAARQMVEPGAHRAVAAHEIVCAPCAATGRSCGCRRFRASRQTPCRRPRSASPAGLPETPAPRPRRSPRSRAASSCPRRPWRGTCSRTARPKR